MRGRLFGHLSCNQSDPSCLQAVLAFRCNIPVASLLMCDTGLSIATGIDFDALREGDFERYLQSKDRLKQSKPLLETIKKIYAIDDLDDMLGDRLRGGR